MNEAVAKYFGYENKTNNCQVSDRQLKIDLLNKKNIILEFEKEKDLNTQNSMKNDIENPLTILAKNPQSQIFGWVLNGTRYSRVG